ncbi:MAG: tRNA (N(6)-L-threonylcarbamoyladenosine(37)-C(2))-methylthiotransferase MtaB [Thermodesulfobacteriota bacterium]
MKTQTPIETVSIHTLGCRSNQYDTSAIEDQISSGGLKLVPFTSPADACIINTCTVTGRTDAQSRQAIRKALRLNPSALVIVTGCYAQVSPDDIAEIDGVDLVLGNPEKGRVMEFLTKGRPKSTRAVVGPSELGTPFSLRAKNIRGRTRANLKIQDGCDRSCTYCIIPQARGRSKSLEAETIISEIKDLCEKGFREFVFTGIHLGGWGTDFKDSSHLTKLLKKIEAQNFPARFRLSSIDPDEITDELIDLLKGAKTICNHLHLPIQSGSDAILRLMHRPYTTDFFSEIVNKLFARVPGISIGTDIITGFPGETEIEFEKTRSLIEALPLNYLHVFPYSVRRGTPAATLPGKVHPAIIKERSAILRKIDAEKREKFYRGFIGSKTNVLIESARDKDTGLMKGRSSNYIPVLIEDYPGAQSGEFSEVLLKEATRKAMFAMVCP